MAQGMVSIWITNSCVVVCIILRREMTHPTRYHRIDLSMSPTEASEAFSVPHSIAVNLLKNKRNLCGVTRDELLREQIEPLIMQHSVTIDECAEKFNLTSERVCKVMGWMSITATTLNPAASQRCTNAGGVASVDKRSAQLGLYCNGLVNHDTCVAGAHSPVT